MAPRHPSLEGQVRRGFERLGIEHRTILVLHHDLGLSAGEVASVLGIPIGTVMSRLSRGRKLLREQLSSVAQSYGIGVPAEERRAQL